MLRYFSNLRFLAWRVKLLLQNVVLVGMKDASHPLWDGVAVIQGGWLNLNYFTNSIYNCHTYASFFSDVNL